MTTTTTTTILTGVSCVVILSVEWLFSSQQVPETKAGQLAGPAVVHEAVAATEVSVQLYLGAVDEVQTLKAEINIQTKGVKNAAPLTPLSEQRKQLETESQSTTTAIAGKQPDDSVGLYVLGCRANIIIRDKL